MFENKALLALVISFIVTITVYIYITTYDTKNRDKRNIFCLKIFVLSFSILFVMFNLFVSNTNDNPLDNIYTCEPDF